MHFDPEPDADNDPDVDVDRDELDGHGERDTYGPGLTAPPLRTDGNDSEPEAVSCPGCGARDLLVVEQHVPPCRYGHLLETEGPDALAVRLMKLADYLDSEPVAGSTTQIVKSAVFCRHCGHRICNICAYNRTCQECKVELDVGTMSSFDSWWAGYIALSPP
jgi:DNA-directed RNA polymerase subunit RPC12/RpoP